MKPAFSFVYDGRSSSELLAEWSSQRNDGTTTWTAPDGLVVRLEERDYDDGAATGWLLRFENTGAERSGVLEELRCLDARSTVVPLKFSEADPATSRWPRVFRSRGSKSAVAEFDYREDQLYRGERIEMSGNGGRSSARWLPFFLTDIRGEGTVYAIGWSGQWACSISLSDESEMRVQAGIEHLRLRLEPGESIRGIRILAMPWTGDRTAAHNAFRRLLLAHHTPRIDGEVVEGPFSIGHWGGMTTQHQLERIALYGEQKLRQEYLWLDAGWHGDDPGFYESEFTIGWTKGRGSWKVNRNYHPDGFAPIVDAAAKIGMKFLLWVEPGNAHPESDWVRDHPDWFLSVPNRPSSQALDFGEELLLDYGNPDALAGAIEGISSLIAENEISLYREDFNIDPEPFWRTVDSPDRVGIAEIRYVTGHYEFWDELLRRHPGLIIDNCASGGKLIDLETISRSLALWRTDYQCFTEFLAEGPQACGMNLSHWLPMHGTGTWAAMPTAESCSTYRVRSAFAPAFQLSSFVRQNQPIQDDYPWDWHRKMSDEFLRCRPYFTADYYPLTGSRATHETPWAAYQMDSPELGGGFVLAFRRTRTSSPQFVATLGGLDPGSRYVLDDVDGGSSWEATGAELRDGLPIDLPEAESSALIFYRRSS